MGNKAELSKEFLGNWYIIRAAKNWFGFHVTFNMCDEIRETYHSLRQEDFDTSEDRFEEALKQYNEKRQEELED